jgi:hypothetical protein
LLARFGVVVAYEAEGEDQSVLSHLKKIVDNENNFLTKEETHEKDLSGPIFVVGCRAVAGIINGF